MSSEFWAGIVGALIGAIAGGGITWLLQHFETKATRKERDQALARSLLFKLIKIHSDLEHFRQHVVSCGELAANSNLKIGWQSFRPIANGPTKLEFTSDEMSYLMKLKNFDLFNNVLSLDALHSSTIDIFDLYAARRLELTSMMPAQMNGMVGEIALNDEQMAIVGPRMAELDDLVGSIRNRAAKDATDAQNALVETNDAVRETLGYKLNLEFQN